MVMEGIISDDIVLSCLAELETYLHKVFASLDYLNYALTADQDYIDNIIIRCERLLVAMLMLSEVDNLSDEMLSGIDAMYDSIGEIVVVLVSDDTIIHVTTLAQPSQNRGCPKLKVCRDQLRFLLDANFTQNGIALF